MATGTPGSWHQGVTPAQFGRRYSPLLALAAVQLLLVALAPSVPGTSGAFGGRSSSGSGNQISAGPGSAAGGPAGSDGVAGTGASGGADLSGGAGSGASGSPPGYLGSGNGQVPGATGPVDRSHCDASGHQIGPSFYMPLCAPVWHGGDNRGATMTGVSATKINYVFYAAQSNAEVNAILNTEGLAATPNQLCTGLKAFDAEINKRWEHYGRTFQSLNGPGNHSGLAQESSCQFPFFQGQCSLTPPDPPCERAEADLIASTLHPAYVMAPVADPAFYNELAKDHILVAGGENQPDVYHTNVAPYYYDVFQSGTRALSVTAEYYCKKLYGKPVQFAGNDVMHPAGSLSPPRRKAAIVFPVTNGDPTYKINADLFVHDITGGMCGSPSDGVKELPYQSDITTAEQQSTTTVAQLKASGVTTVIFYGDPIAPVFLTNTADVQGYHPEFVITGTGLVDYDVLGQLYNPNEWQHAFGISTLQNSLPFSQSEAVKVANDGNGTGGQLDHTENLNWAYYSLMASSFQLAGPAPTPDGIEAGLFTAPPVGGDPLHQLLEFGRPNEFTGFRDDREVYWCKGAVSPINNQAGMYVPVDGGRRFQLGQISAGNPQVFPHGPC